ncbi:hypothetical protein XENTR_v10018027 [Xenopus tropicalis]|nr:hypothetical protein XENTR_v10018027 [Xenopus tropicalis]
MTSEMESSVSRQSHSLKGALYSSEEVAQLFMWDAQYTRYIYVCGSWVYTHTHTHTHTHIYIYRYKHIYTQYRN